jgi:hypothetical protein
LGCGKGVISEQPIPIMTGKPSGHKRLARGGKEINRRPLRGEPCDHWSVSISDRCQWSRDTASYIPLIHTWDWQSTLRPGLSSPLHSVIGWDRLVIDWDRAVIGPDRPVIQRGPRGLAPPIEEEAGRVVRGMPLTNSVFITLLSNIYHAFLFPPDGLTKVHYVNKVGLLRWHGTGITSPVEKWKCLEAI